MGNYLPAPDAVSVSSGPLNVAPQSIMHTMASCPTGWQAYQSKCYYFPTTYVTWTTCNSMCTGTHNGKSISMLCIESLAENTFITSATYGNTFIGLTDQVTEGSFVWNSGCASTFTRYAYGEPNDYPPGEDYVAIYKDSYWNDLPNSQQFCGCEVKFDPDPSASPTIQPS